jgi:poly-gamma-glutamate capsule biosynthesis protein CapA/YwtB (metallophosphatase superfamily)
VDRATLFLAGDVMTGRGIDQLLAHPCDPVLYEPYVRDARDYVELGERVNGAVARPVEPAYLWGWMLDELERIAPAARLVNLETSVTARGWPWPDKSIHYRMNPANVACLTAARLDCCVLANNHTLDWGVEGLADTLSTLERAGLRTAGAGADADRAAAPAIMLLPGGGRLLVFAYGATTSGIPRAWAAQRARAGVHVLDEVSARTARDAAEHILAFRRAGDLVIVSVHWGGNWGYAVPAEQRAFAHTLIDAGAADVVHGHSSHHAKGIEVYRGRLILFGCGDFINDYEGISGHAEYRSDLALAYFPALDTATGALVELTIVPSRIRRFRLESAPRADAEWLRDTLARESRAFGSAVELTRDRRLVLGWQ